MPSVDSLRLLNGLVWEILQKRRRFLQELNLRSGIRSETFLRNTWKNPKQHLWSDSLIQAWHRKITAAQALVAQKSLWFSHSIVLDISWKNSWKIPIGYIRKFPRTSEGFKKKRLLNDSQMILLEDSQKDPLEHSQKKIKHGKIPRRVSRESGKGIERISKIQDEYQEELLQKNFL